MTGPPLLRWKWPAIPCLIAQMAGACLALDAFARAHPLRQPGAPASH